MADEQKTPVETSARPLRGLEKVCKIYGRMKCGTVMMAWDYANEIAVKESEMPPGSKRWSISEKARWSDAQHEPPAH